MGTLYKHYQEEKESEKKNQKQRASKRFVKDCRILLLSWCFMLKMKPEEKRDGGVRGGWRKGGRMWKN